MDSDLAESLAAFKAAFERRRVRHQLAKASPELVAELRQALKIPRRFRDFLAAADPIDVETRTPSERVRLIPAARLLEEQRGFAFTKSGEPEPKPNAAGWRPAWVVIAHSSILGDPYFLDTSQPDAEGDCPVYTALDGTGGQWKPRLCASSFALFLRILAVGMEVAADFADDADMDDEQTFRDTIGPRIREYDPAAVKAGHWT